MTLADSVRLGRLSAERGIYPAGQSLRDELGPEQWSALVPVLERFGYPPELASRQRPWMLQMSLAGAAFLAHGYQQSAGIDLHFLELARRKQLPIRQLETADAQLDLLTGFPAAVQRQMLEHTVRQLSQEELVITDLATLWRQGDAAAIGEFAMQEFRQVPEAEAALIHERNAAMAKKLERWLAEDRSYFVVAGAAHMIGESGLVEALRQAGYKVEQL